MNRGIGLSILCILLAAILPTAWGDAPPQATPGIVLVEARNPDANVRQAPTIEAERVGVIQPGEQYTALGRRFEWILIEFDPAPNGLAWVHQSVILFTGDEASLPNIDPASLPSSAPTATPIETAPPTAVTLTPTIQQSFPTFTAPATTVTPISTIRGEALDEATQIALLQQVYEQQPVNLYYDGAPIVLDPATIEFEVDTDAMQSYLGEDFNLLNIPVAATYSSEQLVAYLEDIALRYDKPSASMSFDSTQLIFVPESPGQRLDVVSAQSRVVAALYSPLNREVELPLVPATESTDMETLERAILNYLVTRGFAYNTADSVVSVYVRDLRTGAEMGLNEHVPHNATSTAKIGVIANYFRYLYGEPSPEMRLRLAATVICSSNSDANMLMEITGNGDPLAGIRRVTDTFCQAGATNTVVDRRFLIGPAGEGSVPLDHYEPAGSPPCPSTTPPDTSLSVALDPSLQTTAADMGHFLDQIYVCAERGDGLAQIFPGEVTQTECQWMLELLRGTHFLHLSELGVPEYVTQAHKVGYGGEAVGDAGIVFSPGSDYALVIYVWDSQLDNFDTYALARWNLVAELSRIVYNFLNPEAPLLRLRVPPNPFGGAACVLPRQAEAVDLNYIDVGRFDASGNPVGTACYDWPNCRPFTGWGS